MYKPLKLTSLLNIIHTTLKYLKIQLFSKFVLSKIKGTQILNITIKSKDEFEYI